MPIEEYKKGKKHKSQERNKCYLVGIESQTRGTKWNNVWTRSGDAEGGGGKTVCREIRIALLILIVLLGRDLLLCPLLLLDDVVRVGVRFKDDGEEDILESWGGYGEGFNIEEISLVLQDPKEGRVACEALFLSRGKVVRSLPVKVSYESAF